jgi:UvrD-like helicase C-terminal domain
MTYHSLGSRWGEPVPEDAGTSYFEDALPARMLDLARALPAEERFDALVVDEAQDFADPWWPPLLAALAEPATGRIAVFGDDGQRVFDRTGRPSVDLVPLALSRNLRNTRQIADLIAPFADERAESLGGVGPQVRFVPCPPDEAVHTADDAVDALLAEGWEPQQVALLTTHHRHPMQAEQVERLGTDGYWASFWDDEQAFYGTVLGFKGLERPVVALAVDGFRDEALAREILYVGMSRARHLLVVCGDLDRIRAVAGKEVAKRLARATVT